MKQCQWIFNALAGVSFSLLCQLSMGQANYPLVRGAFGDLPQPNNIQRVVSAGPVSDTLLVSLVPNKLLGFSTHGLSTEAKKYFPATVQNLPNTGRVAGRDSTFPLEKIVALKPDIIVDVGATSATYISTAERINKLTGIPYIVVSGLLNETPEQLRTLGDLLGASERGKLLADYAEKILSTAEKAHRNQTSKNQAPIKVYFGGGVDGLQTGLAGSIQTEAIEFVGAYNVASEAGKGFSARVSMEQLMKWKPNVIITQDENFYQRLMKDPVWQRIPAVKNGKFYLAPSKPFGWISHPPSINRLLGVIWLTRVLYPEAMSYEEYSKDIRGYYELFYGYKLTAHELANFSKGLE